MNSSPRALHHDSGSIRAVQQGCFISVEGIEGSGKSTLARALAITLEGRGLSVTLTREPGGTPLAEQLRGAVLARGHEPIGPVAETLLMFAARSLHLENLIRPALSAARWVICDRFTDATYAYQGSGRGVDRVLIERLAAAVHRELWPRRTLLLDVPVAVGCARARGRGGSPDRFDAEGERFFERVRAGYLEIAAAQPERVRLIDASGTPEQVAARALEALSDLLPATAS
jgi:dTMP kinase